MWLVCVYKLDTFILDDSAEGDIATVAPPFFKEFIVVWRFNILPFLLLVSSSSPASSVTPTAGPTPRKEFLRKGAFSSAEGEAALCEGWKRNNKGQPHNTSVENLVVMFHQPSNAAIQQWNASKKCLEVAKTIINRRYFRRHVCREIQWNTSIYAKITGVHIITHIQLV